MNENDQIDIDNLEDSSQNQNLDKDTLEKVITQLEGVRKTSIDADQKKRVFWELKRLRQEYETRFGKALSGFDSSLDPFGTASIHLTDISSATGSSDKKVDEQNKDQSKENVTEDASIGTIEGKPSKIDLSGYKYLKLIKIKKYKESNPEHDLDYISSIINFLNEEFWGTISDYNLKLDFNHSMIRDNFYGDLHNIDNLIKNYADIVDFASRSDTNKSYKDKLLQTKAKEYRNLILRIGEFLKKLYSFVSMLLDDRSQGGNIILNPDSALEFDNFHGKKILAGVTVLEGLVCLRDFILEICEFLNIPLTSKSKLIKN